MGPLEAPQRHFRYDSSCRVNLVRNVRLTDWNEADRDRRVPPSRDHDVGDGGGKAVRRVVWLVRRECDRSDPIRMALERLPSRSRRRVPEPGRPVGRGRCDQLAVRQ
jgi:hypothetical protein